MIVSKIFDEKKAKEFHYSRNVTLFQFCADFIVAQEVYFVLPAR